ncbi:outer membrane beta-barrel protein [Arcticibacter tournemirensis]|uniref:Outer membrane protein beta-barrel domain-containing protein n=1 Tax=Arcticibacter tournemirensis TaxID=699437 RepID=A0A4Q0MAJ1_9SPHI|nr:outer membrane beta-barrel protein [Arcticibacter tournemirensis]RXF70204.1 hypothetical protein EKH83_10030 [Arcticibacter tournemirensis]
MKKILLLFLLALVSFGTTYAQTEKGTTHLGLNLNYSSDKTESNSFNAFDNSYDLYESKVNSFSLGPSFSYFIADKLEMGVGVGYTNSTQKSEGRSISYQELKQHQYFTSAFLRKHIMFSSQFGMRTGPYVSYSYLSSKLVYEDQADQKQNINTYAAGINLGIEYFPIKKLGIAANLADLSYNHSKLKHEGFVTYSKSDSFSFSFVSSLNFSIFYVFGKK